MRQIMEVIYRRLYCLNFIVRQFANLAELCQEGFPESAGLVLWLPEHRDIRDVRTVLPDGGIGDIKLLGEWVEGYLDAFARKVRTEDLDPLDDGVQGGETLLAIDN